MGWKAAIKRERQGLLWACIACLTLGLAPYVPHAHVYKQLVNLWRGELQAPMDIFDLILHGAPFVYLLAVLIRIVLAARPVSR